MAVILGNDKPNILYGTDEPDLIRGFKAADTLLGDDGNDTIFGNKGNDVLSGDAGNDYLSGGKGADRIHGGDGDDAIKLGKGKDTLVFWFDETGVDTVLDFKVGKDKIMMVDDTINPKDDPSYVLDYNEKTGLVTGKFDGKEKPLCYIGKGLDIDPSDLAI